MADDIESELRQARLEIARLRAYSARLVRDNDDLRNTVIAARAQATRIAAQLRTVRQSPSWRLTLPLRVFGRRVRDSRRHGG